MMELNPFLPKIWLLVFLLMILVILGLQLFMLTRSAVKSSRKWIRSILNILFTVFITVFLLQPTWESDLGSDPVLVYSKDVTSARIKFLRDSLGSKKAFAIENFQGKGNPVYLIGQRYSELELNKLSGKDVHLIKGEPSLNPQFLHWKGIVRNGEVQHVTGSVSGREASYLELKIQDQVIVFDSIDANHRMFTLKFPVQVTGRNEMGLFLNDSLIADIRFFATPFIPKSFQLRFSFPNPEQRNLSRYLKEKGEKVDEKIQVSRASQIQSGKEDLDSLNVFIGDLNQLKNRNVRAELENGTAGVLVINSGNPESDVRELNEIFDTDFEIQRSGSEEWRELESGIEALPFVFKEKNGQQLLLENSVAFQNVGLMKVGMSLISQTFPVYLSGDTATYARVWDEILGEAIPNQLSNLSYDAPLFSDQIGRIVYNGTAKDSEFTRIADDTVYFQQDLINPFSKESKFTTVDSGWTNLADSLEIYLYGAEELNPIRFVKNVADFLSVNTNGTPVENSNSDKNRVSDWVWLALFLVICGLLWVEPRLDY
ncbi:hypothetical protein JYB64_12090 [Algoriphagus aestuarii]|nr:hypothetical protein [Algoriphagus aestuarii]